MKKLILIFVIILSFSFIRAQNYYDLLFDFGNSDTPSSIASDEFDNIFMCGWYFNNISEGNRGFAVKIDEDGNELWRITDDSISKYHSIKDLDNGNILIVGSRNNRGFVNVVSSYDGQTVWTYQDLQLDWWFGSGFKLGCQEDCKLWLTKTTTAYHYPEFYVFDIDDGRLIEIYSQWPSFDPIALSVVMSDTNYWVSTKVNQSIYGNSVGQFNHCWIYSAVHTPGIDKLDDDLTLVVKANYWGNTADYYLNFLTYNILTESVDGIYIDLDDNGLTVIGSGLSTTNEILITGIENDQVFLWIYDENFIKKEEILYISGNMRSGYDVIGLKSSDIVIIGQEYSGAASDIFLVKTNGDGIVSNNEVRYNNIRIYPNPTTSHITLSNPNATIRLHNLQGRLVLKSDPGEKKVSLNGLAPGVYIATIHEDGKIIGKEKLVKQ